MAYLQPRRGFQPLLALPGVVIWIVMTTALSGGAVMHDNDSWMHVARLLEILQRGHGLEAIPLSSPDVAALSLFRVVVGE